MKTVMVMILTSMLVLSGCFAATTTTTATTASTTDKYLPNTNSKAYLTGVDTLDTADKYLDRAIQLKAFQEDLEGTTKLDEMKAEVLKLFNLYIQRFEINRDMLGELYIIDKNVEKDARVSAYTNLLGASVALMAVDAKIDLIYIDIGISVDSKLLSSRNKLAEVLGKSARGLEETP